MILTQGYLDRQTCQEPGCTNKHEDGLVLTPKCHAEGVVATYFRENGQLRLECAECGAYICDVEVAP